MRLLESLPIALALACAACGGDDDGDDSSPPSFDEAVDDFVQTGCIDGSVCIEIDPAECETEVRADMADAADALDEDGEAACAACLEAKAAAVRAVIDANCDPDALEQGEVIALCDLDPDVDYNGDDIPDNDVTEACAGFP